MSPSFLKRILPFTASLALSVGPAASLAQSALGAEYEAIGYAKEATHNPVARLLARLQSGETQLEYSPTRGYFDSFIAELGIDPSSQVLVFSPTSLQYRLINQRTPRGLYFADDIYIGFVQHSTIVEVATEDELLGTVFYIFNNVKDTTQPLVREKDGRCLVCHDSNGLGVGGVPTVMAMSGLFDQRGNLLRDFSAGNTTDQTPLADRWGGWYVSGQHGAQGHLGNVILNDASQLPQVEQLQRGNLDSLETLFDTTPYLRATSDIVALLVLEHQLTVQNQLTYVKFKAPMVLQRAGHPEARDAASWDALPPNGQRALRRMLNKLADTLLFVDAAPFTERISGNADYVNWFQNQGPRDAQGRSLREFDLNTRLFHYPLSYLVFSPSIDALPPYAKDYLYQELASRLQNDETLAASEHERHAALAILAAIKDDFAPYAEAARAVE
ncbi:MAG: hypothetical protein LBE21_09785 [Pseudomonadales bacterium]|jgi:hypothetical protein|nr:hypothetical protein [Pseudomonadales bacterium]